MIPKRDNFRKTWSLLFWPLGQQTIFCNTSTIYESPTFVFLLSAAMFHRFNGVGLIFKFSPLKTWQVNYDVSDALIFSQQAQFESCYDFIPQIISHLAKLGVRAISQKTTIEMPNPETEYLPIQQNKLV